MQKWLEKVWHGTLKRPYRLAKTYDAGQGTGVILLHGIGRSGSVWSELTKIIETEDIAVRVTAYDLLGFGSSPKPQRVAYTVDDHADAVIAAIMSSKGTKPVILVGHSMGCLVAVRVAKRRPDLIRHLILYEMPLYEGLPEKWRYRARVNTYFRFYDWVTKQNPAFSEVKRQFKERIAIRVAGSELTAETWQPFIKSLKNTIMQQTAANDLPQLTMPIDLIYGSRDMFVIRGEVQKVLGLDSKLVTLHTVRERHVISRKSSKFIEKRIKFALKYSAVAYTD